MDKKEILKEPENNQTPNDKGVVSGSLLDVWECPYCKYIISDIEYLSFKLDFGCLRCKTSFTKFRKIKK